jgi:hypothetical protein
MILIERSCSVVGSIASKNQNGEGAIQWLEAKTIYGQQRSPLAVTHDAARSKK